MLSSSKRLKRFAIAYIKQQAIAITQAAAALGIFFFIIRFAGQYVTSNFPGQIDRDLAILVLQSIVTADGALLGFFGVIAVFAFQALQSRLFSETQPTRLSRIENQKANMFWITLFTIVMFVLSLLSSLVSMSSVAYPTPPTGFYWPVAWMLEGLVGVSTLIWYSTRE
jgi:hypothetical protein